MKIKIYKISKIAKGFTKNNATTKLYHSFWAAFQSATPFQSNVQAKDKIVKI
jgi:hypothetical protein